MPESCCLPDYSHEFDDERARRDLLEYRAHGPKGTTRRLVEALREAGVEGATLLDIGGGVGVIQLELLAAGVSSAQDVDASQPYLRAAEGEAYQRGVEGRIRYLHGDFVAVAGQVDPADVVTLDRVICCYPDARALIRESASRARRLYGVAHPVDRWWTRAFIRVANLFCRISRSSFRAYVHPQALIDGLIADAGLVLRHVDTGWTWRTAIYERR